MDYFSFNQWASIGLAIFVALVLIFICREARIASRSRHQRDANYAEALRRTEQAATRRAGDAIGWTPPERKPAPIQTPASRARDEYKAKRREAFGAPFTITRDGNGINFPMPDGSVAVLHLSDAQAAAIDEGKLVEGGISTSIGKPDGTVEKHRHA